MIANQVGRRYAEAIYEIAVSSDKVKEIYEALNQMMELYKNDNEFKTFITHPLIELDEKKRVLKEMFKNSDETIENIIFYILDKKRRFSMLQSAYISIISGASLWGLIALFFKFLTACGFSPLQIVALRVLFAAVLMTAVIFKIDPKLLKIRWRDSWLFIGTGIFSLVFFNYCYFRSIESSSISIAVLLLYTAPVFVMLLSIFLFREKFTRCKMLALLSTFCGCTFITGIFSSKMTLTLEAFGFGLASGIGYALYSIFSKLALRRYNTLTITAYTFYFAAIAALPMAEPLQLFTLLADLRALIGAIAIALICTVAPYLLYTRGLQDVDAGQASILATLEPLVAAAIGIFIFGESLTTAKILGMILILSSIFILNTAKNNVK